jgi:hypothetical protein
MTHANGARRLRQVLIVTSDPGRDAAHLCRLIDRDARSEADGAIAVPSGADRADFVFLTKDQLGRRYPGISLAGLPERGGAGLVLASANLDTTERILGAAGVRRSGTISVAPSEANGTLLVFVPL